jgi:hypothetical protein
MFVPHSVNSILSFDGKPSPDNPVGVPRRQPDTPASQANPRTPTLLRSSGILADSGILSLVVDKGNDCADVSKELFIKFLEWLITYDGNPSPVIPRTPTLILRFGVLTIIIFLLGNFGFYWS